VDATMVQTGGKAEGIGRAEATYINREVAIKRAEGRRWGAMIGPFGGCWAIRAEAFKPVPGNFLVDDFYLCMAAYEGGWQGISSVEAIVYEGVGQSIKDEFRRKVRISSGNWQNLVRFRHLWWPPFKDPLAFAFFSHKILRWWTPFFVLTGTVCVLLLLLTLGHHWATPLLALLLGLVPALAAADFALAALGIHLRVLRGLRYFLAMNAALLVGFFRYLTGIQSNVWQPTQRH
jgi:cellulose synthase/poly-beta-1,6-N-acetylglucosamine synthase-like glycosyltransferase